MAYLRDLLLEISHIDTNVVEDSCVWMLAKDGVFSVRETSRLIDSMILHALDHSITWDKTLRANLFIIIFYIETIFGSIASSVESLGSSN